MCCKKCISVDQSVVSVLKVLQQLPEGLVIAVLAASPADLEHHISILPADLHPLAVEAAFPSIRQDRSLTLDLYSSSDTISSATYAVMQAATMAARTLQKLHLSSIPVVNNDPLLQMIAAVCKSASDVNLSFGRHYWDHYGHQWHSFAQVGEALSANSALISLQLTFFCVKPCEVFNIDCLLGALTGSLQSLSLEFNAQPSAWKVDLLPVPSRIVNMPSLTYLCLGHGFDDWSLSHVIPHITQLQDLHLKYVSKLQFLPRLATLTALKTLVLSEFCELLKVPPLATLTALQTLQLYRCMSLEEMQPLVTLTALQTLTLSGLKGVKTIPSSVFFKDSKLSGNWSGPALGYLRNIFFPERSCAPLVFLFGAQPKTVFNA
jgi:hypothetical protein